MVPKPSQLSTALLERLELMQQIFRAASDDDLSTSQQIDAILESGCQLFSEDIGIVSRIQGNEYIVENVYPNDGLIEVGQEFDIRGTFCAITLQSEGPLGIADVKKSEWKTHPCTETGLESYIGVPLFVNSERYGTLNFSSSTPHVNPYRALDYEFIGTLAQWVGAVLARSEVIAQLKVEARRDGLTGLPNRRVLLDMLCERAGRVTRDDAFAVLFIDLNDFKLVNDIHGHSVGDALLKHVARRLASAARSEDTVGRFGGDEFLALVEGSSREQVRAVAQRFVDKLSEPFRVEDKNISIEASIGIAMAREGVDVVKLIAEADAGMYKAKHNGAYIGFLD